MRKNDKLSKALKVFGDEYIEELGRELKAAGKDASGNLLKSLNSKVRKTGFGTSYTLQILSLDYLKYVDEGRRAGSKAPPTSGADAQPFLKWLNIKGIPKEMAYPIAKKIGEEGIEPTHVIEKALKKVQSNAKFRKLEDGVSDWVDDLITDNLIGLSKNKNITFK